MWQVFTPTREVAMKRLFALLLLTVFVSATLTACNTVNGAGKDIKKVGEKIEGASSK
jgi:predicted small secreted protein